MSSFSAVVLATDSMGALRTLTVAMIADYVADDHGWLSEGQHEDKGGRIDASLP